MKTFKKFTHTTVFLLFFAFAVFAQTQFVRVKVVDVHDGDSMTVKDQTKRTFKIRLVGIDAPELKQKDGGKARNALNKLLKKDKQNIVVKTFKLDRYNRILAQVFVGEIDVNLEMVKLGWAWLYEIDWKIPPEYHESFQTARQNKLGIFRRGDVIHPSEFRKQQRNKN
jgi:micrococcal nuclease